MSSARSSDVSHILLAVLIMRTFTFRLCWGYWYQTYEHCFGPNYLFLSETESDGALDICLDEEFLNGYLSLNDSSADQLLSALRNEPITTASLYHVSWRMSRILRRNDGASKLRRLCETLGLIPTLKRADILIYANERPWSELQICAVQCLRQIDELMFVGFSHEYDYNADESVEDSDDTSSSDDSDSTDSHELFAPEALLEHSSVKNVILLDVQVEQYQYYIPLLRAAPMLVSVTLNPGDFSMDLGYAEPGTRLIVDLLSLDKPELEINLKRLYFDYECAASVCNAIAGANLKALNLVCCEFDNAESCAGAHEIEHWRSRAAQVEV
ncbi:hypothetical protein MPSEU_000868100 [Mayamaea pseudoterrestris]|nr:hypothetical protein MPSEU_000868100 [Mayamaea pseudoterrestris]